MLDVELLQVNLCADTSSLSQSTFFCLEENSSLNHGVVSYGVNKSNLLNSLNVIQQKNSEYNLGSLRLVFKIASRSSCVMVRSVALFCSTSNSSNSCPVLILQLKSPLTSARASSFLQTKSKILFAYGFVTGVVSNYESFNTFVMFILVLTFFSCLS